MSKPCFDFPSSHSLSHTQPSPLSILVTGGATGIGLAIASALAFKGAYVTIADIQDHEGQTVIDKLRQQHCHAQFVRADVTVYAELVELFKSAARFSPTRTIDVVIPCAGIRGPSIGEAACLETAAMGRAEEEMSLSKGELMEGEIYAIDAPPEMGSSTLQLNLIAVHQTVMLALWYFKRYPGVALMPKPAVTNFSLAGTGLSTEETITMQGARLPGEMPSRVTFDSAQHTIPPPTPAPSISPINQQISTVPPMKHILLIGSLASYTELPMFTDYQAAKFGVRGIFQSLKASAPPPLNNIPPVTREPTSTFTYTPGKAAVGAAAAASSSHKSGHPLDNVRVNMLAPTFIRTPLMAPFLEVLATQGVKIGSVEDVASAAVGVCYDEGIRGRAIAVAPSAYGEEPGCNNFDLGDDAGGLYGALALKRGHELGLFGRAMKKAGEDVKIPIGENKVDIELRNAKSTLGILDDGINNDGKLIDKQDNGGLQVSNPEKEHELQRGDHIQSPASGTTRRVLPHDTMYADEMTTAAPSDDDHHHHHHSGVEPSNQELSRHDSSDVPQPSPLTYSTYPHFETHTNGAQVHLADCTAIETEVHEEWEASREAWRVSLLGRESTVC